MENRRQSIIPNHYFSYVSSECQSLFEHGYYYGCIALCQAVAEAFARFMYEKWTGNPPSETFGANIHKLRAANVQPSVSELLEAIYGGQQRNDFHHLNPTIPAKYEQLRSIAVEKIALLNKVESQVFEYKFGDGTILTRYPQYWETTEGCNNVFLRYDLP